MPLAVASVSGAFVALKFRAEITHPVDWAVGMAAEVTLLSLACGPLFRRLAAGRVLSETVRWAVLAAAGLALMLPYLTTNLVGAGDAQDYAQHLADFIVQVRHGIFPVLVGQSEYAFNGAFNPLRTAPYYQYFGGALDVLTFRVFGPYALQNLTIILSLCAGAFASYFCLRRFAPKRAWLCLFLALLYVSSPGVLALVYDGDMIPSWLTLPYLPLYTYALILIAERGVSVRRLAAITSIVAVVWLVHAPIAMWLSFIALPVVAVRLVRTPGVDGKRAVLLACGAFLLFAVLAGYVFVSVAELRLPDLAQQVAFFRDGDILYILRDGWAGMFRLVNGDGSNLLFNLQLSAPLWLCFALGAVVWRRPGWGLAVILVASAALLILLAPIPAVSGRLWALMPAWVDQITDKWPMQRFYPILSAFAPFAGLLALQRVSRERVWFHRAVAFLLAVGCVGCGNEARKFLARGFQVALPSEISRVRIRGENAVFAIYSYGMLGDAPRYFSYGPVNPALQLHLLDPATLRIAQSNSQAVVEGEAGSGRPWTRQFVPIDQGAELKPPLVFAPGSSYLLRFDFKSVPPQGTLVLNGQNIFGEYPLPTLGRPLAFGAVPGSNSNLSVSVPDKKGETMAIRFVAAAGSGPLPAFADVEVIPYHPENLPFRILDLVPLRISVKAAREGWLETSRIYIAGYEATVDGKPAQIERSPDGQVMVRVPGGDSQLELKYPGSFALRASFWISFIGWLTMGAGWMVARYPRTRRSVEGLAGPEILEVEPGLSLRPAGSIAAFTQAAMANDIHGLETIARVDATTR